jgi:hypothetical protein
MIPNSVNKTYDKMKRRIRHRINIGILKNHKTVNYIYMLIKHRIKK